MVIKLCMYVKLAKLFGHNKKLKSNIVWTIHFKSLIYSAMVGIRTSDGCVTYFYDRLMAKKFISEHFNDVVSVQIGDLRYEPIKYHKLQERFSPPQGSQECSPSPYSKINDIISGKKWNSTYVTETIFVITSIHTYINSNVHHDHQVSMRDSIVDVVLESEFYHRLAEENENSDRTA